MQPKATIQTCVSVFDRYSEGEYHLRVEPGEADRIVQIAYMEGDKRFSHVSIPVEDVDVLITALRIVRDSISTDKK